MREPRATPITQHLSKRLGAFHDTGLRALFEATDHSNSRKAYAAPSRGNAQPASRLTISARCSSTESQSEGG